VATEAADTADTTPKPLLRALLLTDAIDSTKLTQALGDAAMAQHWAVHDRAARDLLPAWRGREIDKTDGMLLLFERAEDAVGYAMAYHRALAATSLPFKARAGIHVGEVVLRANPADDVARGAKPVEVDGIALPVTARVMSVALGGQTLMTGDARIALGITKLRLQSHGHWRLHGLADPMELFEVGDKDAPFTPPHDEAKAYRVARIGDLWQPVREVKHSLPAERDSFVGRQEPLQVLAKKLEGGARLVSVLGMGGTGKTRLVTRFAWMWLGEFPGGVWFCDLSQARTVDGIYFAVAQGLDVPLGKTDPVVQLGHAINGRGKCLVILDNFEQVARLAEETLGRWLDRASHATVIVTSREVLGIVGEQTLVLDPMPGADAAALFLRRAESARQDYRPSADDRAAIEQLVKVLDGLPLAIELAAARVRVMAPRALLARMHERFKLLWSTSGRGDRQATLRAAFDWSWELLSEPEKAALAQLSVFEGGFTLEAAEAVLDLSGVPGAVWIVDVVQWLVSKSFVRQVGGERFDLLESVRDYAGEHLRAERRYPGSGAVAAREAQARHWRHFAGLNERAAVAHGCVEANNLVAACRRSIAAADAPSAIDAIVGAWAALRLTGPFRVGAELAQLAANLPDLAAEHRITVAWVAGSALDMLGDVAAAHTRFDAGLADVALRADARGEARLRIAIGTQCANEGRIADAAGSFERAQCLANDLGDPSLLCLALTGLGRVSDNQGRLDEAREHFEAALALARTTQDRRMEGGLLGNLGGLLHDHGRLDEARTLYEQSLAIAVEAGDRRWEGNAHCNLGLLHHEQGRSKLARSEFETALRVARELGHARLGIIVLCNLGIVLEAQGELEFARVHYEEAVSGAIELSDPRSEGQFLGYLGALEARLGRMEESRLRLREGEARLEGVSDRLSLALLLCHRVTVECIAGERDAARQAFSRAQQIALEMQASADSELGRRLAALTVVTLL
jgi:predicted ATPase/tetratricopeptide (TPR) repeat protein/class 3 adenylate cyclase